MSESISTTGNYYSAAQLAAMRLPDKPTSKKQWYVLAEGGGWPFVEVKSAGRNGHRREYRPPPDIQKLIDDKGLGSAAAPQERPAPDVQQALAALVNPRAYVAYDSAAGDEQNWALLEVLLRFAEGRLTHDVTVPLLDRIDQVVAAWSPVAAGRPDLAARLARVKASVDLLRLAHQ